VARPLAGVEHDKGDFAAIQHSSEISATDRIREAFSVLEHEDPFLLLRIEATVTDEVENMPAVFLQTA
jgi:hypothetical protein